MYMRLPVGIENNGGIAETHILKLLKNQYGGRQAGKVCMNCLAKKLVEADFEQYHVDEPIWYKGGMVFVCYVHVGILISRKDSDIETEIRLIQNL